MNETSELDNSEHKLDGLKIEPNYVEGSTQDESMSSDSFPDRRVQAYTQRFLFSQTFKGKELKDKEHPPDLGFKQLIVDVLEAWVAKGFLKALILNNGDLTKDIPVKQFKTYCAKVKVEEGTNKVKYTTFISVIPRYIPSVLVNSI